MSHLIDSLEPRRLMAAGDTDPSFTRVAASISTPYTDLKQSRAIDVAYDIDGSTVMLASVERDGVRLPVLTRFNPDGSTDYAFGRDGIVLIDIGVASIDATALAIDGGRRINVFSTVVTTDGATQRAMISQFDRKGRLTTRFGSGGHLLPAFTSAAGAADITIDPLTNTIYALSDRGEVVRASPNGRVHAPFGSAGIVDTLGAIGASGVGESIWTDGTKVLVGTTLNTRNGSTDWCVTQLRIANGGYERAFGRRGFAAVDVAGGKRDQLDMITADSYGRIMLAGKRELDAPTTPGQTYADATVAIGRLTANGSLDRNFYRTGLADGYKLGIARQFGDVSYRTTFDGSPILIGQQQDIYTVFNGQLVAQLTLSGREWEVDSDMAIGSSENYRRAAIAQRGTRLVTIATDDSEPLFYQVNARDGGLARILERNPDGSDGFSTSMMLPAGLGPVAVGADGRLMTAVVPGSAFSTRIDRRNPDGSYASSDFLGDDTLAYLETIYNGIIVTRGDGGFEVIYEYRTPAGDSGSYGIWSVDPTGTTTTGDSSSSEQARAAFVALPFGRYSIGTVATTYSFAGVYVAGASIYPSYDEYRDANVLAPNPRYGVPIIGSNDIFVRGTSYIVRMSDSNTLSPAFNNGQPIEINNVDLLYGQADGRLLYTIQGQKGLRRLNTDGTGDTTFGTAGGWMASGFDHFDIDHQGRLVAWRVLTGGASDGDIQLMRFSQNGKVDTTFGGGDGLIIVDTKLPSSATANVVIDTNDNFVVTAHRQSASAISWSATRILGA